ncbi:mechanosensitive ion channel protein 8-like [Alnus glutinosa]|uniref:mechanosensitive ion channel protein 8-like n=1 Tax=Alnus glutinosa TaxID=3517 RepID=UPI002D76A8F1|nr:mechanosensitive ion channel protein 8-like [Alnus glutinosa]
MYHWNKMAQKEGEVVVEVDDSNGCSKETIEVNKISRESPCSDYQASSETFMVARSESVRRRNKDMLDQENRQRSSSSGREEVLRCSSNVSFQRGSRDSWRSVISNTKSRLIDPPEEPCQSSERVVNSGRVREEDKDYEDSDIEDIPQEYKRQKFSKLTLLQWVGLILIIAALVCSLWVPIIKKQTMWDLPLWKWVLVVLALICGRLVSGWGIRVVVFFIERNFLLRKRVLYFVYGLRKSVQNCLWLGLVLVVWHSIFDNKVKKETKSKILPHVNKVLVCFLLGTLIWLLKTLLVKVLASNFHVNTFFERIREALFNQYVIETLSGRPLFKRHGVEEEEAMAEVQEFEKAGVIVPGELRATLLPRSGRVIGSGGLQSPAVGKNSRFSRLMSKRQDEEIPVDHLHKLNLKNISAWNMRRMVNIIQHGALSTLDEQIHNSNIEDEALLQIKSERQAKEAAKRIFQNVAKPGLQYIYLQDVMRFMSKDKSLKTMTLFGIANEKQGISKPSLKDWMVNAFKERRALALSLNDTKTAVDELHNLLNVLVAIIILIIWLIILGVPISHFLVFLSSQLLLVVFIFGNTCKSVFEAIIFLFVMHPFDVGDRCEVEGVQMVVEEMNILTTIFLRYDNQKIIYPNSILATKPIGNYYRSPDMGDAIDFCIHISTPVEKVAMMKERITGYIESKNEHWHTAPMVIMRDVIDMNKLMLSVWLTHKMNYQDMGERWARRALLIEEMIKVFRELDIEYRMLPLDVNIRNMPPLISNRLPSNWATCAS